MRWYHNLQSKMEYDYKFHSNGLERFKVISDSISKQEVILKKNESESLIKKQDLNHKEQELQKSQTEIEILKKACEAEANKFADLRDEVNKEKQLIEEKVTNIKKELDAAAEKVNSINSNDIATLKSTVLIPKHYPKVEPILVSFIAVCTDTILTAEAEIKKQFSSAPNIKN